MCAGSQHLCLGFHLLALVLRIVLQSCPLSSRSQFEPGAGLGGSGGLWKVALYSLSDRNGSQLLDPEGAKSERTAGRQAVEDKGTEKQTSKAK